MKNLKTVSADTSAASIFEKSTTKEVKEQNLIILPSIKAEEPQKEQKKKEKEEAVIIATEELQKCHQTNQRLSIDQLTDKADRVYLLRKKYQEIRDKRKQLESFTISHDGDNAQLTLVDANELTISTSNPIAIGKLLKDWMSDLNSVLEKTENEIREELEFLN